MKRPSGRQVLIISLASVLLGHFFVSLGRTDTLPQLLTESWYYADLFFVSMINFCVILYVGVVHFAMDERIPLRTAAVKRLTYQFLLAVAVPSLLAFFLTFGYMHFILEQDIRHTSFIVYEFPIAVVIILSANLVFIILSLWQQPASANIDSMLTPVEKKSVILVTQGERTLPLNVSDIASFVKEGDYCMISTFDSQRYVTSQTLEELFTVLSDKDFFRANRQWIVNRKSCEHFVTDRSGKIELKLKTDPEGSVTISQKKALEFKAWIAHS